MKILCVEDGSVDLETLEQEGLKDGGVLVYRQGSQKPFVLEVDKAPIKYISKEQWQNLKDFVIQQMRTSAFVERVFDYMNEIEKNANT
jgi:hypothetical protein